jgi:hypothetical protein
MERVLWFVKWLFNLRVRNLIDKQIRKIYGPYLRRSSPIVKPLHAWNLNWKPFQASLVAALAALLIGGNASAQWASSTSDNDTSTTCTGFCWQNSWWVGSSDVAGALVVLDCLDQFGERCANLAEMVDWDLGDFDDLAASSLAIIQDGRLSYELFESPEDTGNPLGEALGDTEVRFDGSTASCQIHPDVLSAPAGQKEEACALVGDSCGSCTYTHNVADQGADISGFVEFPAGPDSSGEFTEDGCDPTLPCRFDLGTGLNRKGSLAAYPSNSDFAEEGQSMIAVASLSAVDPEEDGTYAFAGSLDSLLARFCTSGAINGDRAQGKKGRVECTIRKVKGTPTLIRGAEQDLGTGFFAEIKITPTSVNIDPCQNSCTISALIEPAAGFAVNASTIPNPEQSTMEGQFPTRWGFVGTGDKQALNLDFDRNAVIDGVLASGRTLNPGETLGLVVRFVHEGESKAGGGVVTLK